MNNFLKHSFRLFMLSLFSLFSFDTFSQGDDWRNIDNALSIIPDENYADQPYVVVAKNGDWVCVMTTGPGTESQKGQHMVASISSDKGESWSPLINIEESDAPPSSWGIPYVTPYGRIYVFYTFNGDKIDSYPDGKPLRHNTELGWYCFKYSDDNGRNWSDRHRIPMRKTTLDYINPWNGEVQLFWGISKPFSHENSMFFSFTKMGIHPQDMGEGFLYRSDNINYEKDVSKLNWELLPEGNIGISYTPLGVTQEEHNVVPLNNGDLYCSYRTSEGYPANAYSNDNGKTWSTPEYIQYADGRVVKNPRACPRVFKTFEGKYLLWHHNNNIKGYKGHRNPVWISGGIEKDGKIYWSQPEVLLYGPPELRGMSYPDMIEENGKFWITETQKTVARVHEIDRNLLEELWKQGTKGQVTRKGFLLEKNNISGQSDLNFPEFPSLQDNSFSIELLANINELRIGQILLDNTDSQGNGLKIEMTPERTFELILNDGDISDSLDTDPGMITTGENHIVFIVDGRANLLTSVVNGKLCDGGRYRLQGWSWFDKGISNVNGSRQLRVAPDIDGYIKILRIYDRYLTTSEAIGNYLACCGQKGDQVKKYEIKHLFSRDELIKYGYPFGKYGEDIPLGDPDIEWKRSDPDITVFLPTGSGIYNGDNEHFLVFKAPKSDELIALWTQSSVEGKGNNHLVLARSKDAENWSPPKYLAGARYGKGGLQASWGFPVVSSKGRIYVFYTKETEIYDNNRQGSGTMGCIYSDDNGYNWTEPQEIDMPRSKYDNPDKKYPKNWIVWQKPIKDSKEKWFAGYTLTTSNSVMKSEKNWVNSDSRCYFMRFINIDDNSEPADIEIEWYPENDQGLEVENSVYPHMSVAQEPAVVLLPDGRLFTVMRNMSGYIYYSVSADNGKTWNEPQMLRYRDSGEGIKHPMSPCPLYKLSNGKFILIFHNNEGKRLGYDQSDKNWKINVANIIRNPTYYAVGQFMKNAKQPIWFDRPVEILNTNDIAVPPKMTAEIGTYPSITEFHGKTILWYPDRKRFLLGKYIDL